MPILKKWQKFEKIVAAIHRVEHLGATVVWDDTINGRQFDVSVRFTHGTYSYLTVVECRDEARRVVVGDIEAFVTKASDVLANKAVFVSASGFQSGCIEVAQRHGISLFTLAETIELPEDLLSDEFVAAINVYNVELIMPDGLSRSLATDERPESYLVPHIIMRHGDKRNSLSQAIEWRLKEHKQPITPIEVRLQVLLPKKTMATLPYEDEPLPVSSVMFSVKLVKARTFKGAAFDPDAFATSRYTYRDVLAGKETSYCKDSLPIDYGTEFAPGRFYKQDQGFRYYCDAVTDGVAALYLVESYQLGRLMQAQFAQKAEYAKLQ
jgi:hypothetical protein